MERKPFSLCEIVFTVVDESTGRTDTYSNQIRLTGHFDADEKLVAALEQFHIERISISLYRNINAFLRKDETGREDTSQDDAIREQKRARRRAKPEQKATDDLHNETNEK